MTDLTHAACCPKSDRSLDSCTCALAERRKIAELKAKLYKATKLLAEGVEERERMRPVVKAAIELVDVMNSGSFSGRRPMWLESMLRPVVAAVKTLRAEPPPPEPAGKLTEEGRNQP